MARRMSGRIRLFVAAAMLPLVLFALSPLVSSGQDLGSKSQGKKGQTEVRARPEPRLEDPAQAGPDPVAQGPRARPELGHLELHAEDQRPPGRDHDAAG